MAGSGSKSTHVAIVHLARCANGDAALQDFLSLYREQAPGIAHDLVVVLKGYEQNPESKKLALDAIQSHQARAVPIPDEGRDLDAYRIAVETFDYSYYCFMNSFARPTREGWLSPMMHWAHQPGIGIVGATASYESVYSDYIDVFKNALGRQTRTACEGAAHRPGGAGQRSGLSRLVGGALLLYPFRCAHAFTQFAAFPNAHIRTNGFVLSRQVIDRLRWPPTPTKSHAFVVESGRAGITSQVLRMGLDAVVVGRNGRGYLRPEWPASGTFWQGTQDNLLIIDNQTRDYERASPERRRLMRRRAWQHLADERP